MRKNMIITYHMYSQKSSARICWLNIFSILVKLFFSINQLYQFFKIHILHMSNQILQFDLGTAFPILTSFLSPSDKISLSTTCTMLRKLIFRPNIWQTLEINLNLFKAHHQSEQYLQWLSKYIDTIQPRQIMISLIVEQEEQPQKWELVFAKLFKQKKSFVRDLSFRTNNDFLHLMICFFCNNLTKLSLHSNTVSDKLVEKMFQICQNISEFEIIADALEFTGQNMQNYIKQPLTKLVLKPYQLNYESILQLLLNAHLNEINEFQIDVEQCQETLLLKIINELKCVKKLRLYHMQFFYDHELIASKMSKEMSQLTLTKCYNLQMWPIIQKISSKELQQLDLTQALLIKDCQIDYLADKACYLRHINLSWCNQITNSSIAKLIESCKYIQKMVLNGIKNLSDQAFSQYFQLKGQFLEKQYDEIRYNFKNQFKKRGQKKAEDFCNEYFQKLQPNKLFIKPISPRKTLRRLKHLECNSCNNINDITLKIIGSFNGKCSVINYYGEDLCLLDTNTMFEDEFY